MKLQDISPFVRYVHFLPIDKIKSAIKDGCHSVHEFAEYLDVPEQFIIKAFQHYTAMDLI